MAEAVRPKKTKTRSRNAPAVPAHAGPSFVDGFRLPDVPSGPLQESERVLTPEPEEIHSADNSLVAEEPVAVSSVPVVPEAVLIDVSTPAAEPIDISKLIFPRMPVDDTSNGAIHAESEPSYRMTDRVAVPPAYPTVPELSALSDYKQPTHVIRTKPPDYASLDTKENAPPMYPSVGAVIFEKSEHGLMTEQQLLTFYYNPVYETADDFVDKFVQNEEIPSGPLLYLLKRLKALSEAITLTETSEKTNTEVLSKCLRESWVQYPQNMEFKGRCGENKEAQGTVTYNTAMYSAEKGNELKNLLTANRNLLLDQRLCNESQFRSVALQIQWQVITINNQFMSEHALTVQSSPNLVESVVPTAGRSLLLCALSDLFYHLRSPNLSSRFVDAVTGWIRELVCVLHMSCRACDGQFVLNHLLRLPSPISSWASPLIQTFVQAPSTAKLKIDYCLAMMSHIMNPIKGREAFLQQIGLSEKEDAAWTILSDDEEHGDFSFVTVNETDLTALFDQLPVSEFYSVAYLHSSSAFPDKTSQFLSTLAFQLLLLKILNDGLSNYSRPGYKQFCKQIGNSIRQSVRELCSHWRVTKDIVAGSDGEQVQKEVDRVLLLALQYLINRDSVGLWQFLVDLPYDCVSEECRSRCELMIRCPTKLSLDEVFSIPQPELIARIKTGGLRERAEAIGPLDAVFLVNALSAIVSYSHNDPSIFVKELIDVCYCDDTSRESLYKVGAEGIATLLTRRPMLLDCLVSILDRNIDHMDNYAVDVLASSTLLSCKISPAVMGIIGKWLINNAPNEPANRLARRILSGLHWGYSDDGAGLWIEEKVHEICADSVIKAHAKHCNGSNGMIAKSISKIAKLASKVADHEQMFSQFCWDILIKLKLPLQQASKEKTLNDLAAFYEVLVRSHVKSVQSFLGQGLNLLSELASSGSSIASVIVLSRLIANNHAEIGLISSNKTFMDVFERVIHVDQCSYAVQWLSGPSSTPTPIVKLICCAISHNAKQVNDVSSFLKAWIDVLCVKRATIWNTDQATLQILGTIARVAFLKDASSFLGLKEILHNLYTQMLAAWRDSNKGFLSFLSSDSAPPPLIQQQFYSVSPWATYLLLLVESKAFPTFYQYMYEVLAKKEKNTLEHAVKKAASKCSMNLAIPSLIPFCWAAFIPLCYETPIYPLAVQRLATEVYRIRTVNGQNFQFARRIVDCATMTNTMNECKKVLLDNPDHKGLSKAVAGWLFTTVEVTRSNFDFSQFDLDYLLQLILARDRNVWLDFVDISKLNVEDENDVKLFISTCHLGPRSRRSLGGGVSSPNRFVTSRALPFPVLPSHPGLPPAPPVDASMLFNSSAIAGMAGPLVKGIGTLAEEYLIGCEKIATEDETYSELLTKLYSAVSRNLPVIMRCTTRCPNPVNSHATVSVMEFNKVVDGQMTQNREKRSGLWTELFGSLMDKTAVHTAGLEHIARQISRLAALCPPTNRGMAQTAGRAFFYQLTGSIGGADVLFPCAAAAYANALRTLGQEFVRNRPEEQIAVMRLVLDGFVFSDPLVEAFTPECLSSTELCDAYARLSDAVRDPERSPRALKLLGRLGIDKAAAILPPHQFAPLLPLAFRNLASQPDPSTPLHQLCMQHVVSFVFHAFPANFPAGLDLALEGCNTGVTPVELLQTFVNLLGAENFNSVKADFNMPAHKCTDCATITARRLAEARSRLPALYSVWGRYIPQVTRLAQLFLYVPAAAAFQPDSPLSVLQRDLVEVFGRISSVFSPLLAVYTPTIPPFSPSHDSEAKLVVDRLVELLAAIPHSQSVPPGMQNLNSLVWQFYYEKLSTLTHGTAHYFGIIESGLIRLQWGAFHPSLRGLQAMDECLQSRSRDCASFITQMIVRIPWKQVLATHIPADMIPSYLHTLSSVITRIVSYPTCYTKVSASFLDLLKSLSQRQDWKSVTPEDCDSLAHAIGATLPPESLASPSEHVAVFQIIWRKICCFSPREPFSTTALLKQTTWLRTEGVLLLRGSTTDAPVAYTSLISDVHAVASNHENPRAFCVVARELTALWSNIPDKKFGETVVSSWNKFLESNPDSPLVLMSLNTIIGSLNADQLTMALNVMESTIRSYFKRAGAKWEEVMQWIQFPNLSMLPVQQYLLCLPSSSTNVKPLHLVMKAFLDYGRHDDSVFLSLHAYIIGVKPKHVTCEASFVLVMHRFLSWLAHRCSSSPSAFPISDDLLHPLIRWLTKAAKDDSSFLTNLISAKKNAHTPKLRAIFTILESYLLQQSLGEGRKPRCDGNIPVINARINGVKEAANTKAFVPFASAFNLSTAYFSQVDIHHLGSAPQLLLRSAQAVFNERFLSDI